MQWNDPTLTLTTPGYTILFNQETGDTYVNDPQQCSGLDGAPVRSTVDDKPQSHGGIVHTKFYGPRHITLQGTLLIRTAGTEAGYLAARDDLEDQLVAACDEILNTEGTLAWRSGSRSLAVTCDIAPTYAGANLKTYVFGLVAADPII